MTDTLHLSAQADHLHIQYTAAASWHGGRTDTACLYVPCSACCCRASFIAVLTAAAGSHGSLNQEICALPDVQCYMYPVWVSLMIDGGWWLHPFVELACQMPPFDVAAASRGRSTCLCLAAPREPALAVAAVSHLYFSHRRSATLARLLPDVCVPQDLFAWWPAPHFLHSSG